jgi:hypothetical protein
MCEDWGLIEDYSLAGPPLTEKGAVQTLIDAGVTVALGSNDASIARNTRLDVGWVRLPFSVPRCVLY